MAGRGVSKSVVVHDVYVARLNAVVARGRESDADLLAEFEMVLAQARASAHAAYKEAKGGEVGA